MLTCYVALNEDIVNPLLARNSKEYTEATITNVRPKFPSLKFLTQKDISYTKNPKYCSIILGKANHHYGQGQEHPDEAH